MIKIEIYSDVICPWCLIGWTRLKKALARPGAPEVTVRWLPFELNPDMPAAGMSRQEYLARKFGGTEGAKSVYSQVEAAAASEGLALNFDAITRTPNTFNAHRLIWWAHEQSVEGESGTTEGAPAGAGLAVKQRLFELYFTEGADIGDTDVLVSAADAVGLPAADARAFLLASEGTPIVRELEDRAHQLGISGVPFFIINRQLGVSGAQPPEVFTQVFDQIADQSPVQPPDSPAIDASN